jgi:hypothetical protein
VFLLTVSFVFGFVPTMFQPYATGDSSEMVFADRTVRYVAADALAVSPADPYELDPACSAAFFAAEDDYEPPGGCDFDPEDSLGTILAADGRTVNVTLRPLNETTGAPATFRYDGDEITLERGPTSGSSDVVVAQRVVTLEARQYRLVVRTW